MIEDAIEDLTDALRGRRCLADDGHGGRWHGRFGGSMDDGAAITLLFGHPDPDRETMVQSLRLHRETVVGVAFEPATGTAAWRTPPRLVVRMSDGATATVTEDDEAERPAPKPAPSTKQGRRPSQFTKEGAHAA